MKQLLTLFTFCILSSSLLAQDYFPFLKTGDSYYHSETGVTFTLSVSDSSVNNQWRFAPNLQKNAKRNSFICQVLLNTSWMGKRLIRINDTTYHFINHADKPVILYTNSHSGQNWQAYQDSTTTVTFTHLKDTIVNVLGNLDSVKVITTSLFSENFTIWLSKNHGLIYTLNFYKFPNLSHYDQSDIYEPTTLSLVSNSNTNLPLQNITWKQIYDFEIGDEFHYLNYNIYISGLNSGNNPERNIDTCRSIYTVYNKVMYTDSFTYYFKRRSYCRKQTLTSDSTSLVTDSVSITYQGNSYTDRLPGITYLTKPDYVFDIKLKRNTIEKSNIISDVYLNQDTCASMMFDAYNDRYFYYKGAGGPYYGSYYSDLMFTSGSGHELVYYKKLNQTWGNPWPQNLSVTNHSLQQKFSVYPNPSKNILKVNNPNTREHNFKLVNMLGEVVFETTLNQGENNLNISSLHAGIYFYHIQQANQLETGKLVVE